MKKIILMLLSIFSVAVMYAQGSATQVNLTIGSGAYIVASGSSNFVMDTGNMVNNGTYIDSTGLFIASGGITFSGSGVTRFNNFDVNNAQQSTVNSLVSVYNTADVIAGNLNANNNLYIRSDANNIANLVVAGVLTNYVQGIIARATVTSGSCPSYTSDLSLNISGPVVSYQWQSSTDSATWSDLSGAISASYIATVTATTYYRCNLATTNSSYSESTPGVKLTFTGGLPGTGTISGASSVCQGATTPLSDATGSGVWSSTNTAVGTVSGGIVTGISAGTTTVSYTVTNGCGTAATTKVVTVNPLPNAGSIAGASSVCVGSNITLTDGAVSGVWSSTNTAVGTVSTVGGVTGIGAGSTTISYTLTNGCGNTSATAVVTVTSLPNAGTITGVATVCTGVATNLSNATGGGVWSSGSPGIAAVGSTGIVTGVTTGTSKISYTVTNSCGSVSAIQIVTVNTISAGTIAGASSVNTGANITLTDAVTSGTWSASNANATVSGDMVTGVTAGTVTISYSVTGSCGTAVATKVITVNNASLPGINGNVSICAGTITTLTDATTGGTWSSSNGAVATIGGTTGIVTGLAAGTTNITYTQGGASATVIFTVNAIPLPVQGATSACAGTMITLTDNTSGGTWSSSGDVSVVTAGTNSGTVTEGATAGTGTITYTLSDGCYMTYPNTVLAGPSAIFGATTVCVGSTTVLSDTTMTAVSWTSSNTLVATVAITGHVTGVAGGAVTITYKASSGCIATTTVSVTSTPGAITGNTPVCAGSAITLGDVSGAGTWSSSNAAIAAVGTASGVVTGVAGGTATITYFPNAGGCKATAAVTVNAILPITGNGSVCAGGITTLYDASAGGTWSSSNTSIATVGSTTGIATGVSVGSASVTYTLASGCIRTTTVTVAGSMSPIAGTTSLCASSTATLSDASSGTWSSSNTLMASVGTSGLVTASAVNTGTVTISYSGSGCVATVILTVNANPLPVQGAISECAGTTVTLTDNTSGGTWSITGDAGISGTGVLTAGAIAGTATVTYTIGTGCFITYPNTVIKNPSAIFGAFTVCAGSVTILSDSSATGVSWASSNTLAATVAATGHVTGVASGTAIITYKALPGNCIATAIVTVNAVPIVNAIAGPTSIAEGAPQTLTETTPGGIWSSSNTAKILLSGSTGLTVTATAESTIGSSVISYAVTSDGCTTTKTLTITSANPPPHGGSTTGVETTAGKTSEVLLYPNPANSAINIRADVAGVFYLYSLDGKSLGQYKIAEGINNITLPADMAAGIYMGRYIDTDGNATMFKIMKQ